MSKLQFTCQQCQKPFQAYKREGGAARKYCSAACRRAGLAKTGLQTATCQHCGRSFQSYLHARKTLTYCSNACDKAAKASKTLRSATCNYCGSTFEAYTTAARPVLRYCSIACGKASKAAQVPHTCPECGKSFTFYRSIPRVYCSKQCAGKHSTLAKSKPPKGPHSRIRVLQRNKRGPNWMAQKRQARHRDQYTCQRCGRTEAELGYALHVHHIIRFHTFGLARYKEANSLRNLVCLCNPCHGKVEHQGWHPRP